MNIEHKGIEIYVPLLQSMFCYSFSQRDKIARYTRISAQVNCNHYIDENMKLILAKIMFHRDKQKKMLIGSTS